MSELTLFELPESVTDEAPTVDSRSKQLRIMHQDHGITEGKTCGECAFIVRGQYEGRGPYYFKCKHYTPWTHGPGTDWRKFWQACGKFEVQEKINA